MPGHYEDFLDLVERCFDGFEFQYGGNRSIDIIFLDSSIPELIRKNLGIMERRDVPSWIQEGNVVEPVSLIKQIKKKSLEKKKKDGDAE